MKTHSITHKQEQNRPSREDAEKAIETLIRWAGADPNQKELLKTPQRVLKAYDEHFSGYQKDVTGIFGQNLEDARGYDHMVVLSDLTLHSHCQHHLHPIIGKVHIAYWPDGKLAGLSKLKRLVDVLAKRLISQETLTHDIRQSIDTELATKGSAVIIKAQHLCMVTRGICDKDAFTTTVSYSGLFEKDRDIQERFTKQISV